MRSEKNAVTAIMKPYSASTCGANEEACSGKNGISADSLKRKPKRRG